MNLQELLKKLMASAQALLDGVDANQGGIMTAEQAIEFDALTKQIDGTKAQILAREEFTAQVVSLNTGTGRAGQTPGIVVGKDRIENDPKRGFANIGEFALSVMAAVPGGNGRIDERLLPLAAPSGQMGARGGDESFQVPTEFRNGIWEQVQGSETSFDVYNFFNPEPTSLSTVEVTKDETTPWGSTGVQSYWGSESAQMTASSLVTKKDYVGVHQLYAYVLASDELLSDLPRLNDRLTNKAGQAIRFKASSAIVAGDGIGKPKGFTVGGSIVEQAKETNQTADTIVIANIAKMYSRLINPQRGFWMIHPDAFPQIIALQYANGTAAWTDNNMGFKNTPNGRLLGQPIYLTEHNQTLGDAGDIYFVNPDGYLLLQKSSAPEYAESIHLYFDYNIKAFRWIFRMGGQPYSNAAVSPKNGSTTRSHFLSLAARA